jgi:hypothetical protein
MGRAKRRSKRRRRAESLRLIRLRLGHLLQSLFPTGFTRVRHVYILRSAPNVRNGWKAASACATIAGMRFALIVLVVACCAACAEHRPLSVRAIGEGSSCTVTVNGAVISTDTDLQALARTTAKTALVETDRKTPYRCAGVTAIRLQQAGFKVVGFTVDGVPIPSS